MGAKKKKRKDDPLLRVSQVAAMTGHSLSYIRTLALKGLIEFEIAPNGERMFRESAVEAYEKFRTETPLRRGRPKLPAAEKAKRQKRKAAIDAAVEKLEAFIVNAEDAADRKRALAVVLMLRSNDPADRSRTKELARLLKGTERAASIIKLAEDMQAS